jgi:hypothetical protein
MQMLCDVPDVNYTYKQKDCTVHQNAPCIYVFRMIIRIIREQY